MTSKAFLEKIGEDVRSIIANQLAENEKDVIEFLWKHYLKFQGG